jgi:hypothetical protein
MVACPTQYDAIIKLSPPEKVPKAMSNVKAQGSKEIQSSNGKL